MENFRKLVLVLLLTMVFLLGYTLGGDMSIATLQMSMTRAIVDAVDMEQAREYWQTIRSSHLAYKITEMATVAGKKLVEWICILLNHVV